MSAASASLLAVANFSEIPLRRARQDKPDTDSVAESRVSCSARSAFIGSHRVSIDQAKCSRDLMIQTLDTRNGHARFSLLEAGIAEDFPRVGHLLALRSPVGACFRPCTRAT